MIGYVYLDYDKNLHYRDGTYIDTQDPGFWGRNSYSIDIVWKVDTTDDASMLRLLTSLKSQQIPTVAVKNLCSMLDFDLQGFMEKRASLNKPLTPEF